MNKINLNSTVHCLAQSTLYKFDKFILPKLATRCKVASLRHIEEPTEVTLLNVYCRKLPKGGTPKILCTYGISLVTFNQTLSIPLYITLGEGSMQWLPIGLNYMK